MKKLTQLSMVAIVGCIALQGCATKHYGRQVPLSAAEQNTMNCREINLDLAKAIGFIEYVHKESEFDWKDLLAILGDFGIGNIWEHKAALESADRRIDALKVLKRKKKC